MKYIKKPVVVEALQLDTLGFVSEEWFWDAVARNDIIIHNFDRLFTFSSAWCEIKTLEGTMVAKAGDYIVKGVKGEIYPCKADIFEQTYEAMN